MGWLAWDIDGQIVANMCADDTTVTTERTERRRDGNWIQKKKVVPGAGKKIVVEKVAPRSLNIIGNSTRQWSD